MARPFIEHVNLTVSDPDATARMLNAVFGWEERWRGPARDGGWTIHIGTSDCYMALYTGPDGQHRGVRFGKGQPFSHIGIEVADLDAIEAKVTAQGLTPFNHDDYAPGRRFYFFDNDGIEYEVISYAAQAGATM